LADDTILYLTLTDQSHNRLAKYIDLDIGFRCNPQNDFTMPLSKIFAKVISYDYVKSYVEKGVKLANQEICDIVRKERPGYVIWRTSSYHIQESTFQYIRKMGAIVIGWFWDDHFRFDNYSRLYIPCLDYSVTNDPQTIDKYKSFNAKGIYAECGSTPEYCKRLDLIKNYDVSFVGAKISNREFIINEILDKGLFVNLFGNGWGKNIPFDQMINIYNSSKINLNFTGIGDGNVKQIKGRIFEIAMCGGFLLSEYAPGLDELFKLNEEIVCFETVEEAVDKIRFYLEHDALRQSIADAGWRRAHQDYTWHARLAGVINKIKMDIETNGPPDRSSENKQLPRQIRRLPSIYHYQWAKALLSENQLDFLKDEVGLSLEYDKFNIRVRCISFIASLPIYMHHQLLNLYCTVEKHLKYVKSMLRSIRIPKNVTKI